MVGVVFVMNQNYFWYFVCKMMIIHSSIEAVPPSYFLQSGGRFRVLERSEANLGEIEVSLISLF